MSAFWPRFWALYYIQSCIIASGSLMRTVIFSHTRKMNTGSGLSCMNWVHRSVATTSSTGAPPSATTTPLNPKNASSVDDRSNEPPLKNGTYGPAAIRASLARGFARSGTSPGPAPLRTGRNGRLPQVCQRPPTPRAPALRLFAELEPARLESTAAGRGPHCSKVRQHLPARDFPDPLRVALGRPL